MINLPNEVNILFDIFNNSSYELYLIGGCVRDYLLTGSRSDYDFTTSAPPKVVQDLLKDYEVSTYKEELGLSLVKINNYSFEITTMRKEIGVKNFRYPKKIIFVNDLKEDVKRRDFTINAIAYNPKTGIIDYTNGQNDLNNKIIKFIGRPSKRCYEDPLRILRGIRFTEKLGFYLNEKTYKSFVHNAYRIKHLGQIKYKELFKICELPNGIDILKEYQNIIIKAFPEFKEHYNLILNSNLKNHNLSILLMYLSNYMEHYETLRSDKNILNNLKDKSLEEIITMLQ